MQTHEDRSHNSEEFLKALRTKADKMMAERSSEITAGKQEEEPLARWKGNNGMHVTHLPDDEHGIIRISVGGGQEPDIPLTLQYCVIRGGVGKCIEMLERAVQALRDCPY